MRSAPLVTLDRDTCVAIDELIDEFLDSQEPSEISAWEEEMHAIWMTLVPVVHLAFAAGKEYYSDMHGNNHISGPHCGGTPHLNKELCFVENKLSKANIPKVDEVNSGDMVKSQSTCTSPLLEDSDRRQEKPSDVPESKKITTSLMSENEECVITGRKDQFTCPGSKSTQRLGIFSLLHTLAIKENQQTALSENLLPYLVCLSWHLKCDERQKLRTCLANFENIPPPSLKVAAKSVLAIVYGLDMVFNL